MNRRFRATWLLLAILSIGSARPLPGAEPGPASAPSENPTANLTVTTLQLGPSNSFVAAGASSDQRQLEAEAHILAALDGPLEIDFVETPLHDVVNYLADRLQVPTYLDIQNLEDAGIGADTPVTLRMAQIRARSVLDLLLEPLDLDWVIAKEVLYITTRDRSSQLLTVRVYPVADLVAARARPATARRAMGGGGGGGGGMGVQPPNPQPVPAVAAVAADPAPFDFDSLIDAITTTVLPNTWDEVGGSGSIVEFIGPGGPVVVVSQTREGHEQLIELFNRLRRSAGTVALNVTSTQETAAIGAVPRSQLMPTVWPQAIRTSGDSAGAPLLVPSPAELPTVRPLPEPSQGAVPPNAIFGPSHRTR